MSIVETRTRKAAESGIATPRKDFNVGAALRYTYRFIYQAMQEQLTPYGISMGMFYFFMCLWEQDGHTQRELSDLVGTMGPGTVEQLRRMEARGYIVRRVSRVDRRKIHVFLTPKGHALKREIVPRARALNVKALRGLSADDIEHLRACLLTIRKNIRGMPSTQPAQHG